MSICDNTHKAKGVSSEAAPPFPFHFPYSFLITLRLGIPLPRKVVIDEDTCA